MSKFELILNIGDDDGLSSNVSLGHPSRILVGD